MLTEAGIIVTSANPLPYSKGTGRGSQGYGILLARLSSNMGLGWAQASVPAEIAAYHSRPCILALAKTHDQACPVLFLPRLSYLSSFCFIRADTDLTSLWPVALSFLDRKPPQWRQVSQCFIGRSVNPVIVHAPECSGCSRLVVSASFLLWPEIDSCGAKRLEAVRFSQHTSIDFHSWVMLLPMGWPIVAIVVHKTGLSHRFNTVFPS